MILIKIIKQINKHKAKYIITTCIPIIIIKKFLIFIKKIIIIKKFLHHRIIKKKNSCIYKYGPK